MSDKRFGYVSMAVVDAALDPYQVHERKKVGIVYDQTNDEVLAITPNGPVTAEWIAGVLQAAEEAPHD